MKEQQCLNGYCAQWFDSSLSMCPYCGLKLITTEGAKSNWCKAYKLLLPL